ncbi:MAG: 30S ribosomal protein S1 [Actinobacteria bacterium]|nr:MAG: 30S ribosomal protein S1 [Actinomycetota bacterium]
MKLEEKASGQATPSQNLEDGYKLDEDGNLVPDYDGTMKFFEDGDLIEGNVVRIDRDEVLVDVGYKSEGVIPIKELSIKHNVAPDKVIEVGQSITTLVLQKEDADGRLILSKKRADFEKAWDDIGAAYRNGEPIQGTVIEIVKGGLILDVGVRGFLPASLVDFNRSKELDQFLGQEFECKIIEMNRQRNNVVLSRRAILEGEKKTEKAELINKLERGQIIKGKISSIVDFGAFVDLGGIDGLIHISELSWSHISHPSEVVKMGEEVNVVVLEINKEKGRVSLGYKQTQEDSWKKTVEAYNIGDIYDAKVTRCLPFGVFVEFGDGMEGLIHISELSYKPVNDPHKFINVGDEVKVKLLSIDLERRRISLSLKQTEERAEEPDSADASPDKQETVDQPAGRQGSQQGTELEAESASGHKVGTDIQPDEDAMSPKKAVEEEKAQEPEVKEETAEEKTEEVQDEELKDEETAETVEEKAEETTQEEKVEEVKEETPAEEPAAEETETVIEKETKTEKVVEEVKEEIEKKPAEEPQLGGLDDEEDDSNVDPGSLEDVLAQMKKSHGTKDK